MTSKRPAPQPVKTKMFASSSVTTQIENVKYQHDWIIDNFSARREKPGLQFRSPSFPVSATPTKLKWHLEVYPRGCSQEENNYLGIFLVQDSNGVGNNGMANFKISVLNSRREELASAISELSLCTRTWAHRKFIQNKILTELYDDKIIILCEISTVEDHISNSDDFVIPECTLPSDYGLLFENQTYYDFTLSVGDREFRVHKAILSARSSYFEAMFNNEMKENVSNKAIITDFDQEVVKEMLRYVYTGKVSNLENMATELLAVADKYALERLKNLSAEVLYKNLSVENAAEIFILADLHSADQLKSKTKHFISTHAKDVINTTGWDIMSETYPLLLKEAYSALATLPTSYVEPAPKVSIGTYNNNTHYFGIGTIQKQL